MKFLGIDFGWTSQPSGLCCLEYRDRTLYLLDLQRIATIADVLVWVDGWTPENEAAGIAVDAPTLIPNATGMRLPDRLTHKHFGKYHAGCYPANLSRPFAQRTVQFGLSLEQRGFAHAPTIVPQQPMRFQIEVFPHPAMIHLFRLDRILKYKKGKLIDRQAELTRLLQLIYTVLPQAEPALDLSHSPVALPTIPTTGAAIKVVEDQLDSVICAFVAAHWWYWGTAQNTVLGDRHHGYIVVPTPTHLDPV